MADAMNTLNGGNVLNFVTPDTTDYVYCVNGIYITDTFTAEIGLELKAGQHFLFQLDSCFMKNATFGADGIDGTPVAVPDTDVLTTMEQAFLDTDDCSKSYIVGSNFNPYDNHKILIAAYLTYDNGWGDAYTVGYNYLYYDETDETFTPLPQNTDGNYIEGEDLGTYPPYINIESVYYGTTQYNMEPRLNNFYTYTGIPVLWATHRDALLAGYIYATSFSTNIPLFDTRAHAEAYLRNNSVTTGLLNGSTADPEEEYVEERKFWYIKNIYGHNTTVAPNYDHARNYRFFPKNQQKIALLYHKPTASAPYSYTLETDYTYNVKTADAFKYDDSDYSDSSSFDTEYLRKSISFGSDNYYTVFKWDTNIPTIDTQEDLDDYFAGRKTIDEVATNWKDISRQNNDLVAPDLPGLDKDDQTPTGYNGMSYTYGAKLYEVTNIELAALFSEMFTPQNLQAILDGNKLFGDDVFNAISNIVYLPLSDLSDICTFGSGSNNIWIGSWESQNAQGRLISKNDKKINCGSFFFADNFGDFRSLDPFQRFFVMIPFCGFFELTVSKYIGKTVKVEMAIDITTGGVLAMLYANNILMDQFSGQCGASRPVTARDSATYFSNIVNAITGSAGTFGSAGKGAMQAAKGLSSGAGGAAVLGGAALGVGVAAVGAVGGTLKAYQLKEAIDSPPIMSSGALAGCMSYFSNTKVHFIVAQKKTVRPLNELETIGYPSNQGGTVGSFSGFLSCSAFKMADSFTGTKRELQMIYDIMKGGIYL